MAREGRPKVGRDSMNESDQRVQAAIRGARVALGVLTIIIVLTYSSKYWDKPLMEIAASIIGVMIVGGIVGWVRAS